MRKQRASTETIRTIATRSRAAPAHAIAMKKPTNTKAITTVAPLRSTASLTPAVGWRTVLAAYLDAGYDSAETRRAYSRAIEDGLQALGVASLEELNGAQLAAWRAEISSRPLAPATISLRLAALRSFLTWARAMGACALPADVVRAALRGVRGDVRRPYQVLSEPEVGALLAAATTLRDRAIFAVLFGAGLRVGELVALDVDDMIEDQDGGAVLHVAHGKGNRSRDVPVRADVAACVRAYLASGGRTIGQSGPLFRSHDRGADRRARARLTARSVGYVVAQTARRAAITAKTISPHSLRHTAAIRTLRHSGNIVAVGKLLGHRSLTTTQRYVDHLGLGELRAALPDLPAV